jgi:hypothetical protein
MPAMADLVVKKDDGVTNVTYVALNPSSGDSVPAFWRFEAMGTQADLRATMSLRAQWNGPRTARRVEGTFQYPHVSTDTTTGLTSVVSRVPISYSATVPANIPDTAVAEAVSQFANIMAATLIKACCKAGFAPT